MFTLAAGTTQTTVLTITLVVFTIVIAFMIFAAFQTRKDIEYEKVSTVGYRFRTPWMFGLILLLVVFGAFSFANLPQAKIKNADPERSEKVEAIASQFGFVLKPNKVTVGNRVIFHVTSTDVNHGFGVYDPDGKMLGQIQAMPTRTNKLAIDIEKPGKYQVLCMEYCGLFHHMMMAQFDAEAADGSNTSDKETA